MRADSKRSTWLVLGALLGGMLLGVLSNQAGAIREPLMRRVLERVMAGNAAVSPASPLPELEPL